MTVADDILAKAGSLPPFPAVVQRALALLSDPLAAADDILEAIRYDQSITADVIKMCNSSLLAGTRPVSTLKDALVRIGNRALVHIILSAGGADLLQREVTGYDLARGELWKHSVLCALLAESLCDVVPYEARDKAFTAGLLHDIGKLAMSEFVGREYAAIQEAATSGRIPFLEAERKVLGLDHAEVGGRIGEEWRFDDELVAAIRHHHNPVGGGQGALPLIVHLSDLLCLTSGIGVGADGLQYKADYELLRGNGIGPREFEMAMIRLVEVEQRFHGIVAMYD